MNKAEEKVFRMAADFLEEQRRVQNLFFFFLVLARCSAVLSSGEKIAYCRFKYCLRDTRDTMAEIALKEAATLKQ